MAESIGRDIEEIYRAANRGVLSEVTLLEEINMASRACVEEFVKGESGVEEAEGLIGFGVCEKGSG
jgi:magnesium chelatase subunit H